MDDDFVLPYVASLEGKNYWSFEDRERTLVELKTLFLSLIFIGLHLLTLILRTFMFF